MIFEAFGTQATKSYLVEGNMILWYLLEKPPLQHAAIEISDETDKRGEGEWLADGRGFSRKLTSLSYQNLPSYSLL